MQQDGGSSEYADDKAGANYGVGYCDAQCPHDIKFIQGAANAEGWKDGIGKFGSCCMEFDLWEANSISQAFTAHPCTVEEQEKCDGLDCGDGEDRFKGVCDKDGCDFGTYRLGNHTFYGPGSEFDIDTRSPFTVITQFLTDNQQDDGEIVEVRRKYIQNGNTIETPAIDINGKKYDSLTDDFCTDVKEWFGDNNDYMNKGGLKQMSKALSGGMTLVMSIWDDSSVYMNWLDSNYPPNEDPSKPGVARGTCSEDAGKPENVRKEYPNSRYVLTDLRYGDIDSTYGEFYTAPKQYFTQ